ncbi:ATP/GTP-binding protein [Streptomyces lydicus]|uniref:ATP/GTP-binding protein n=1 Tax=Streptomyces lydicus TaxID=47763 RepID=UPI0037A90560
MAGGDLKVLFRTNDPGLRATEAFTNRQAQWEAVAGGLEGHMRRVTGPGFNAEDLEAPRTNLLVFHGVGGIGKTTLSRRLEAALADEVHRPEQWERNVHGDARLVPVRIDLARSAGVDFERLVLTLRLALARIGRPLPAFDLALRRYWEHQHPGQSLEEYLRSGGLASRYGQALPQQMQSVLGDVAQALALPGTIGTVIGQMTVSLIGALRERRQTVRVLAGCWRLADLLEAEPDLEALSFYPHLLAWELAQLPADKRVVPVVLLDTFEDVGDRTHRDLERLIQRVVWLMPNAYFIVTGRSRLQWGDAALQGQLDWAGPTAWPGLAAHSLPHQASRGIGHGRQVLIGDFSPEDCEDYLARRLIHDGQPLIPAPIRQVIAKRSHGLPLYLDLSVMRFLELRRGGNTPQAGDFEADFPALIARTLADLTPEERSVLRSVALLDSFDLQLATQTAGLSHQSAALRLTERPFVRENPWGLWPFHLHDLIRSTLLNAEDHTDDRWSPDDWLAAARRAHTALGEAWQAGDGVDRRLLVSCLRQGLALARDFRLELGWLADAAWVYVRDAIWEPLAPPARDENERGQGRLETAADGLGEVLSALARRQHEHRGHIADRLARVIDAGVLPADLREMPLYYLAKDQRDLGDSAASLRGMQQVADGGGRMAPDARRGLAHLARLAGDFPTTLSLARQAGREGRGQRIEGDVWWAHGDMARAAAAYRTARGEAEEEGVAGEVAVCQAQLSLALSFTDSQAAAEEISLAEQLLAQLDMRATDLTVRIAALARDAGRDDADIEDRARLVRTEAQVGGVKEAEVKLELVLAFHHAIRAKREQLDVGPGRLGELAKGGDHAHCIEIARFMSGLPPTPEATVQWVDVADDVRRRWHRLVQQRLSCQGPA